MTSTTVGKHVRHLFAMFIYSSAFHLFTVYGAPSFVTRLGRQGKGVTHCSGIEFTRSFLRGSWGKHHRKVPLRFHRKWQSPAPGKGTQGNLLYYLPLNFRIHRGYHPHFKQKVDTLVAFTVGKRATLCPPALIHIKPSSSLT